MYNLITAVFICLLSITNIIYSQECNQGAETIVCGNLQIQLLQQIPGRHSLQPLVDNKLAPNAKLVPAGVFYHNVNPTSLEISTDCCPLIYFRWEVWWPNNYGCIQEYEYPQGYEWCQSDLVYWGCFEQEWHSSWGVYSYIDVGGQWETTCGTNGSITEFILIHNPYASTPCPGDFNVDNRVDGNDLVVSMSEPFWSINKIDGVIDVIINWGCHGNY